MDRHRVTKKFGNDCTVKTRPCLSQGDGCDTVVCPDLACCSNNDYESLNCLLYNTEDKLRDYTVLEHNYRRYGYKKPDKLRNKYEDLKVHAEVLKRHLRSLLYGYESCLDCSSVQILVEKIKKIVGVGCDVRYRTDLIKDDSYKSIWNETNPYCVSREKWETRAYRVCDDIGIDMSIVNETKAKEISCQVYFELEYSPVMCEILHHVSIYKYNCEMGLQLNYKKTDCEIGYELLQKKVNCDIDFDTYYKLIDCNISIEMISKVYDCGMSLRFRRSKDKCPILVTLTGQEIDLCDINFNSIIDIGTCNEIFN